MAGKISNKDVGVIKRILGSAVGDSKISNRDIGAIKRILGSAVGDSKISDTDVKNMKKNMKGYSKGGGVRKSKR
jgi:hypothetical protein|tara:strand:+ start:19909 stop:20130 length:222 start_codon:yes stop_codon:yes gene_type:complete